MSPADIGKMLRHRTSLLGHIESVLLDERPNSGLVGITPQNLARASVVLFVLGPVRFNGGSEPPEPCLILNKRSEKVRQAGDLCCPGGGLSWGRDRFISKLVQMLPGSPLRRWRGWGSESPASRRLISLLLSVGLREAWEEMRLNPLRFTFLGMLPEQHLVMFNRVIYPMAGWVPIQSFKPNWEVERIVPIPLRHLLDADRYGRFRPLILGMGDPEEQQVHATDFPCFIHDDSNGSETLWGATYRMVVDFLERVFGFEPPATQQMPLTQRHLGHAYLNGSR